jgi:hypothetical protein
MIRPANRIEQLKKIVALWRGAKSAGERTAAAAAFRRRRGGTAYERYTIEEFSALGNAVPIHPWRRRHTRSRPPAPTPEQREAAARAAESRRRENAERAAAAAREKAQWVALFQAIADGLAAQYARHVAAERARIAAEQERRERLRQRPRDTKGRFMLAKGKGKRTADLPII